MRIVFPQQVWDELHNHMLGDQARKHGDETLVFMLTAPNKSADVSSMVVRKLVKPASADYIRRSRMGIRPTPEFVASVLSECRREGYGLIEAHTHPFDSSDQTTFSGTDWANDEAKMPQLAGFMDNGFQHATMVMGTRSLDAHYFEPDNRTIRAVESIVIVGSSRDGQVLSTVIPNGWNAGASTNPKVLARHDRHARFVGAEGVHRLRDLSVGLVGVGGIGSFVATELAHLGIGRLVLVDPDTVEATNLNRLIGATPGDVGRAKVDVLSENIAALSDSSVQVLALETPIDAPQSVAALKGCDVLLGCLDNHGARLVLNQLAVQYVIPFIDAGTGITLEPEVRFGGQVQIVTPGRGCLVCRGFINATHAAFDLASPEHQEYERSHGYGTREPAPSVITVNGVVASLQASMVLRIAAQDGLAEDMIVYEGSRGRMFPARVPGNSDCEVCGVGGLTGYADLLSIASDVSVSPTSTHLPSPAT